MATVDDTEITIADSYAAAVLELAEAAGASEDLLEEFGGLVAALEQEETLRYFLISPAVDDDARREGLEKAFRGQASDLLVNTLQVLNAKGRMQILPTLYERYRLALEEIRGEIDVEITTALPLPDALREPLTESLRRRTGKTPRLIEKVDDSVLGGLIVQIGDEKLDGSAAHHLRLLRGTLRERASREIHAGKDYLEGAQD